MELEAWAFLELSAVKMERESGALAFLRLSGVWAEEESGALADPESKGPPALRP